MFAHHDSPAVRRSVGSASTTSGRPSRWTTSATPGSGRYRRPNLLYRDLLSSPRSGLYVDAIRANSLTSHRWLRRDREGGLPGAQVLKRSIVPLATGSFHSGLPSVAGAQRPATEAPVHAGH